MEYVLDKNTTATLDFVDENGEPFTINLLEQLAFSDATLMGDMEKQPGRYAWWASVLERAKQRQRSAEDNLEYLSSLLSNEFRKEIGKASVAVIKDNVVSTDKYQEALQELRYWEGEVGMLSYAVKSFEQRERMLMQKSAQLRKSLANDAKM